MRPLVFLVALAALLGSGCGSEEAPSQPAASPPPAAPAKPANCRRFGAYRRCGLGPSRIERRTDDGSWVLVTGPLGKKVHGRWVGHWRNVFASPDGKTLVATWSAECEVPIAMFIPAKGGKPRAASGHRDWTKAPESIALGWEGGRAQFEFLKAACGFGIHRPGVYLVDPVTYEKTYVSGPRKP